MSKKINIIFIIPSLRAGGAERVMSFIASHLNKELFSPHLLVIGTSENQSYHVDGIPVTFLNKKKVRNGLLPISNFLLKQNVHLVVSAMGHVNTLMAFIAFFFPKIKFIGRETIVRSARKQYAKKKIKNYNLYSKLQSISLDAMICQSNDMQFDLIENYGFPSNKLHVINNPITQKFRLKNIIQNNTKQFITVGRLTKQKGFLRIIRSLSKLSYPFHYTIIGQGEDEEILLDYIKEMKMQNSVTHIPYTKEVENYLAQSDIYLQGSFAEGFPNALLESCAVGTPVLAFNAPGGINEIIEEGINGFIANDEESFTKKLESSIHKEWNPKIIRESVTKRYSEKIILKKYEDLFLKIYNS